MPPDKKESRPRWAKREAAHFVTNANSSTSLPDRTQALAEAKPSEERILRQRECAPWA
jgi:hypothetical protein